MKAKELIEILSRNPKATLNFKINPSNADDENIDITANIDVFGTDVIEELSEIDIIITPKVKSSSSFETIHELITECRTVRIDINKKGMYVFGDGELRRELDFRTNNPQNKEAIVINKLIEIL